MHKPRCALQVYVAPLPTEFNWNCTSSLAPTGHEPTGNESISEYRATPSLEVLAYNKLARSPCRTLNRSEASLVYLPYFADACAAFTARVLGARKLPLSRNTELQALEQRLHAHLRATEAPVLFSCPERYLLVFGRFFKDLVSQHSVFSWFRGAKRLTVLAIELLSQQGNLDAVHRLYPRALAVPYPSNYRAPPPALWRPRHRRVAVAAAFSIEGLAASQRKRAALLVGCKRQQSARRCAWQLPGGGHDGSMYSSASATRVLPLYERAAFCLQPAGDSLTRKGLWDALGAGCVPVAFDERTLSQYAPRHVAPDGALSLRVTIHNASTAVDALVGLHRAGAAAKMRAAIAAAWWAAQYDTQQPWLPEEARGAAEGSRRASDAGGASHICDAFCVAMRAVAAMPVQCGAGAGAARRNGRRRAQKRNVRRRSRARVTASPSSAESPKVRAL